MSIQPKTSGVHHIALRVRDYEAARRFYIDTLGFEVAMEGGGLLLFMAGGTAIAVREPGDRTAENDAFDPFRVGLDHVALACPDEEELQRVADALEERGIWTTGVKTDETLGKRYMAFRDPDGIKWEYYMT